MLKAIGWLIKASVFAIVVLVIANYLKVGSKTVSDHLKTQLSHAENAEVVGEVKDWAQHVTKDHRGGILKKTDIETGIAAAKAEAEPALARAKAALAPARKTASTEAGTVGEEISSTERQKLRALMRELNSSRGSN